MRKEGEILKRYGQSNPFRVPDKYFEEFHEQLMKKISSANQARLHPETSTPTSSCQEGTGKASKRRSLHTLFQGIPIWWRVAAVAIIAVSLSFLIYQQGNEARLDTLSLSVAEEGKEGYTEEEIRDIIDGSCLDDYDLYQLMISEAN